MSGYAAGWPSVSPGGKTEGSAQNNSTSQPPYPYPSAPPPPLPGGYLPPNPSMPPPPGQAPPGFPHPPRWAPPPHGAPMPPIPPHGGPMPPIPPPYYGGPPPPPIPNSYNQPPPGWSPRQPGYQGYSSFPRPPRGSSSYQPRQTYDSKPSYNHGYQPAPVPIEEETVVERVSEEQQWVNEWLEKKKIKIKTKDKPENVITVADARMLFREALILTQKLKKALSETSESENSIETTAPMNEIITIKTRLSSIRDRLDNPEVITHLKDRLSKISKKRKRLSNLRESRKAEKEETQLKRRETEEKITQWHKAIHDHQEAVKKERELKKAADVTLSEVRRKITDAKRGEELLTSLAKLRQVRKESAERRGLHTPSDVDAMFEERLTRMKELIERQSDVYAAEAKTLEVMMETENIQDERRVKGETVQREKDKLRKLEKHIRQMLFGPEDLHDADDPLYPYKEYYYAPQKHLQAFLQVRSGWDVFCVPEETPGSSSVPLQWVIPVAPSSENWESSLKQRETQEEPKTQT